MNRERLKTVNPEAILLENIFLALDGMTFSRDQSARIVGGLGKLEQLIAAGKIEAFKGKNVQNSKWQCNAVQVMQNCRDFRRIKAREGQNE